MIIHVHHANDLMVLVSLLSEYATDCHEDFINKLH